MNETERPRISKKVWIGIGIYATVFFAIILISNIDEVNKWISVINSILSPIITGLVIAYLANPFFKIFEGRVLLHVRPFQLRRFLALLLTYLLLLLIIGGLALLILPQLISSIQNFSQNFNVNLEKALQQINNLIGNLNGRLPVKESGEPMIPSLNKDAITKGILSVWNFILQAARDHLRPENIGALTNIISRTGVLLTNLLVGVFISIYLLASKEKRYAQIMKFRRAYLGDRLNRRITKFCTIADKSFGGFLRGKLLDSTIVGGLVYITCLIFNIPYAILVAVIIGITDIVPVIGPFIGVIPTAVIILLTDPIKVIFFLVAILVIQQIDGNIIAPKILGENTGVSSLCVMISILVMGELLGLLGMIIGVPLFATVIELVKILLDNRLRAKGRTDEIDLSSDKKTSAKRTSSGSRGSTALLLAESKQTALRAYALAKKHRLFDTSAEGQLDAFASECTPEASDHAQSSTKKEEPADKVTADPSATTTGDTTERTEAADTKTPSGSEEISEGGDSEK